MAQPIVDGVKEQMEDEIELIHLNLLGAVGRKAARTYSVYIVPVTLLFDGRGELITRKMGMPKANQLVESIGRLGQSSAQREDGR